MATVVPPVEGQLLMGRDYDVAARPCHKIADDTRFDINRWFVHQEDDSSFPLMTSAILSQVPGHRLLSPLYGCDGESLPQGTGISPTPGREAYHLHTDQVIKDQIDLSRLSPVTLASRGFRETDRTWM